MPDERTAALERMAALHTDVTEVGGVAERAGGRELILSHYLPAEPDAITDAKWAERARQGFSGRTTAGRDTIVSRETPPGEIAVVTVGSVHGGTRSNLIPDHALLQLNLRSYSQQTRERMLASIQRIVRSEGQASGSPQDPGFETVGSFPLTVNDPATTDRVAAAFATRFGGHALEIDRQTVSEDFSNIPNAAGVPYTYWGMGFTDEKTYRAAEKAGRLQDLPTNHSPKFLPPLQPTLRSGTEALVTAALAWLEPRLHR